MLDEDNLPQTGYELKSILTVQVFGTARSNHVPPRDSGLWHTMGLVVLDYRLAIVELGPGYPGLLFRSPTYSRSDEIHYER